MVLAGAEAVFFESLAVSKHAWILVGFEGRQYARAVCYGGFRPQDS